MHITHILSATPLSVSFEFFPPRSEEGAEQLFQVVRELESVRPSFVSMTYGAGGTTRELTHALVVRIKQTTSLEAIPHLTCVSHSEAEIADILSRYAQAGIDNVLALGGDPPKHIPSYDRQHDAFKHASDLIDFIVRFNREGRHPNVSGFGIGVAGFPEGHPATPNRLLEVDHLKRKVDAGADYIVTQLFFNNHDYFDFCERCELAGIKLPILAGIMPITTVAGMRRMADLAAGARFPAALLRAIHAAGDDADRVRDVGIEWSTRQCADLVAQRARGIHFYTLNKSRATLQVCRDLGFAGNAPVS